MDSVTTQLVSYAKAFSPSQVSAAAIDATMDRIVDSIACAIVGSDAEPARIAVESARGITCDRPATVFGAGFRTTPELAAFANTSMVRTYDWNDGMMAQGGGHPSDMIPAVLAAAETVHASGTDVITGIALAYELLGALGNVAPIRDRGWDQGTFMGVAAAVAVARMLDLDEAQMGNAASLALVPHVPLRVNRTGVLSMWKGCATASAMHSALFAVRLAQLGMTGPAEPFEGRTGLWEQATGPFDLRLPANADGRLVVEISHLKQFPAETHGQALLGLMPRVRAWRPVDDIASIEIETYWQAYHEIAMHPSKWDPQTRETADHSMPYLLAVALVDGAIDVRSSFTPDRIADPALRPLMRKISVREDPEFTAGFRPPGGGIAGVPRARLIVTDVHGDRFVEEVGYHRGHSKNPMSRDEINAKFDAASAGVIDEAARDRIRDAWWRAADADDIATVIATTADFAR
ncbi:MAG TPA: MmgE/PrpD family protein [Micromonosporaceae bacterium]|nr:MmgE/PrpD family protein [Micromonosporaceae bacterium]